MGNQRPTQQLAVTRKGAQSHFLTAAEFYVPVRERRAKLPDGKYAEWVKSRAGTFTSKDMAAAFGVHQKRAASQLIKLEHDGVVKAVSERSKQKLIVWRAK